MVKLIYFSIIGGNLGLFTGMSILSLFEIIFWIVRFITRTWSRVKEKKRKRINKPLTPKTKTKSRKNIRKRSTKKFGNAWPENGVPVSNQK